MEFLRKRRFKRTPKPKNELDPESVSIESGVLQDLKTENVDAVPKDVSETPAAEDFEDDDDDFITQEVKRRLKELRRNSFMVLIPEEPSPEEAEEEETSSDEYRESSEERNAWSGFGAFYEKYCERMLFFDKMSGKFLVEAGHRNQQCLTPKSSSKLVLALRTLSFKKKDELQGDGEPLQQEKEEDDPNDNLERSYVAQICLSWEALHYQYMELCQLISSQRESFLFFGNAIQAFQQFQVLLQRFVENEPFDDGTRAEIYLRARSHLPKLLQVPDFHVLYDKEKEDGSDASDLAPDLAKVLRECILTFYQFLKADKKRASGPLNLFADHNHNEISLQQIQNSFNKKEMKLKELLKKKKNWKKCMHATPEEVSLLFGLIDVKVASRVLRMRRVSNEQLLWCEEKMCKLNISDSGLQRDSIPVLFPC